MNLPDIQSFIPIVLQACVDASEAIMKVYETDFDLTRKLDGSPVTKADLESNALIQKALEQTKLPVIMEEIKNEPFETRKKWDTVWIVDPLDGTKEFIRKNGEFVVCIALVHKNQSIFGVIASPVKKKILFGGKGISATCISFNEVNQQETWIPIQAKDTVNNPLQIAGSRSHHSKNEESFNQKMRDTFGEIEFIQKGSALKFFDLALGTADVYPRFAPTMEWDIAAGQAIIESLGGSVNHVETDLPLTYNKENLLNPFFVVKTKAVIDRLKK
ncbi:3'(2'),5'-bisphosphate nucleotidase CysQ family protein [Fluviicola taffensis]|uniref:3'(2'),5'-bisphosphate nucleotidase CysQ n=1 Tax=Fluviicola taffensis (strain DSM 16823 / NCIMB 13979 / RW262) TaxID=755732 RepID=F2IJM1_FLUTR|nr:3'(2'),5'-bisphosphate nucleotidase CysQ [Fluviicola taffensis]AEA43911.1 inositol monophosphatase [Fluviicola taffensis DSM 16823]